MITTFDLANLLGVDAAAEHANLGAAIDSVRVVDANGLAPVDPGYTPTSDLHLAAAAYVEALAVRSSVSLVDSPPLERITSEGSTFELGKGVDLYALANRLRAMSALAPAQGIGFIELGRPATFTPRSEGIL